ncbi:MAG: polyprenyl synthetase family protein [Propioniciclava sp.]
MSSLTYPGADPAFEAAVRDRLDAIEAALQAAAAADTEFVTAAAQHLLEAGGKRLRPLLVVLGSLLVDKPNVERVDRAAVVVELTHVASLYHDDVMDSADMRRGVPSANHEWGNTVAILVGDYLFSKASTTVATLGTDFVLLQAETFARLVQGQIAETRGPADTEDALAHYLAVVADKTGSLIAASAVFGGMVAGASADILSALDAFGEELGIVFQLSDDVIDIASDESGKTPGTDLREGVPTLPTLMLAASTEPADARLRELVSRPLQTEPEVEEALRGLREHRVLADARAEIRRRGALAQQHLAPLPEGPAKRALVALCDTLVQRTA